MKSQKQAVRVGRSKLGRGVFARKPFRKKQEIGEMAGNVARSQAEADPYYCVDLGEQGYLNPEAPFRFLNHSCEPNCELVEWMDRLPKADGSPRLSVHALRTIRLGEELTIDYAWPADEAPLECLCGAASCRGYVVDKRQLKSQRALLKRQSPSSSAA